MIRNVIFFSTSGMVLFSKQFVTSVTQARMTGSLLAALIEFSTLNVGLPVSYIEMSTVAVTLVMNELRTTICALFHDLEDGAIFGRVIATQLLARFIEHFPREMLTSISVNVSYFQSFSSRIPHAIRLCIVPILAKLEREKGLYAAVVVTDEQQTYSPRPIDRLAIVANLQFLINSAADVLSCKRDVAVELLLDSDRRRVYVRRIDHAILIVLGKRWANTSSTAKAIDSALIMLIKVFALLESIHETR